MKPLRSLRFFLQRAFRGWDDSETWAVDYYVSKFTLPRLKRYKKINIVDWEYHDKDAGCNILDEIIWLHETIIEENDTGGIEIDTERFERASLLWGKYYRYLWW